MSAPLFTHTNIDTTLPFPISQEAVFRIADELCREFGGAFRNDSATDDQYIRLQGLLTEVTCYCGSLDGREFDRYGISGPAEAGARVKKLLLELVEKTGPAKEQFTVRLGLPLPFALKSEDALEVVAELFKRLGSPFEPRPLPSVEWLRGYNKSERQWESGERKILETHETAETFEYGPIPSDLVLTVMGLPGGVQLKLRDFVSSGVYEHAFLEGFPEDAERVRKLLLEILSEHFAERVQWRENPTVPPAWKALCLRQPVRIRTVSNFVSPAPLIILDGKPTAGALLVKHDTCLPLGPLPASAPEHIQFKVVRESKDRPPTVLEIFKLLVLDAAAPEQIFHQPMRAEGDVNFLGLNYNQGAFTAWRAGEWILRELNRPEPAMSQIMYGVAIQNSAGDPWAFFAEYAHDDYAGRFEYMFIGERIIINKLHERLFEELKRRGWYRGTI